VLPVKENLVVEEPRALTTHYLLPQSFVLQEFQEMETNRILEVLDVWWLLPVLQILEIVDETGIFEVTSLCKEMQVVWITQTLNKLHLNLKSEFQLILRFIMAHG